MKNIENVEQINESHWLEMIKGSISIFAVNLLITETRIFQDN